MAKCIKNGNFVTVIVVLLNVFELIPFPDLTLRLLISPKVTKCGTTRQASGAGQSWWLRAGGQSPGRERRGSV